MVPSWYKCYYLGTGDTIESSACGTAVSRTQGEQFYSLGLEYGKINRLTTCRLCAPSLLLLCLQPGRTGMSILTWPILLWGQVCLGHSLTHHPKTAKAIDAG